MYLVLLRVLKVEGESTYECALYTNNLAKESVVVFFREMSGVHERGRALKKIATEARGHQLGLGTKQPWPLKSSMSPESSKCHKFV